MIWLSQNWQGLVGIASLLLGTIVYALHFFHVSGPVKAAIEDAFTEVEKLPGATPLNIPADSQAAPKPPSA